jgi:hypothetical protein
MDKTKEFIEKSIKVHNDKYDYSKVNYINSKTKVLIVCKKHGDFEQNPYNHMYGMGCPICGKEKSHNTQRYDTNIFIEKAIQKHGDLYDYSKVDYISCNKKVLIICKIHGDFEQTPSHHLQGQGCCKCNITNSSNTKDFITKAIKLHNDLYDYSKVNYIASRFKILIICKKHGEFYQTPNSHLNGVGCKKCSEYKKENFIQNAIKIHGDKYDYSKVNYINSKTDVIVICKSHGEFTQRPSHHIHGTGCKKCSIISLKSNTDEFIEKAIQKHGDLYDYSKVDYISCNEKVLIICKKHGEFHQKASGHLTGWGCYMCRKEKIGDKNRDNISVFIEKAKEVHNEIYDYSKVNYIDSKTKVLIVCKKHGDFKQTPSGHLQGKGCCKCAFDKTGILKKSNTDEFIKKSKSIYGDIFTYENTQYTYSHTNIIITCKEHGDFSIRPNNHINSFQGCPKCQNLKQHSKNSIIWLNFVMKYYNIIIDHAENSKEYTIPTTRYRADGYCKNTNTVYEFHGSYWHGDPTRYNANLMNDTTNCTFGELYERTIEKENVIKMLGYNLVVMWESKWNKINKSIKILQNKFKNM